MEKLAVSENNKRYFLLDSVRGLCILGMIVYHALFDIVYFFGFEVSEALINSVNIVRDFGAACFICLSGICIHFGHRPFKRALIIAAGAAIVSAVSYIVMPESPIYFGILTFMASASFIMIPLKKYLDKLPPLIFAVLSFLLFMLTFNAYAGNIGYYGLIIAEWPELFYANYFTAYLGFPPYYFMSADYFPLMPWIFMFFFGFFLWKLLEKNRFVLKILNFRIKILEKIGKASLWIYIGHQPVVMGVLLAVFYLIHHFA